jgi:PAB1-binding protein PBP1
MLKEIDKLRESYIDGLDRKRATLAEKRDEVAAEAIAKEIELARTEPSHFQKIIGCEIDESNDSDEWDQLENRTDQRDESDE